MTWIFPQSWYWLVGDQSPSTQVWQASTGGFVVLSNSDYVAFLAAGNVATSIDTLANLEVVIDSFNQSLTRPGYISIVISGSNYTFTSPTNGLIPKTINISFSDTPGRAVVLPQANLFGSIALGTSTLITNNDSNSNSVAVLLNDGSSQIATIPLTGAALIIPTANTNTNGTWEVFYLSEIGSAASGKLLIAQGTTAPTFEAVSGDATITNTGAVTVSKLSSFPAQSIATNSTGAIVAPARHSIANQSPTGTTSTAARVMMGIGGNFTFTPTATGNFLVFMEGSGSNTVAASGFNARMAYGTGTAPNNGDAATGTAFGPVAQSSVVGASGFADAGITAYLTGLTVGTTYWLDVALEAVTSGTASLVVQFDVVEI